MTDQTTPDVTDDDRRLAREWAAYIESNTDYRGDSSKDPWRDRVRAAAHVILNAVPALPRPTLADMTREERAECRWMQADVKGRSARYVIATPSDRNGLAGLVSADGGIEWAYPERITPRPDLPRMEWPGDQKPEPAPAPALPGDWRLADHPDHGCVIVANPTPNRAGNVCFVMPAVDGDPRGFAWHICSPNVLTYIDQEDDQ